MRVRAVTPGDARALACGPPRLVSFAPMRLLLLLSLAVPGAGLPGRVCVAQHGPRISLPAAPVAGEPFTLEARLAGGDPAGGADIGVRDASGRPLRRVIAGSDGRVDLVLDSAGAYVLAWQAGGVEVLVPFHVGAPRPALWWTVPLALLLGWMAVRRARAARPPALAAASAVEDR
jgi:hypothetical protein